MKKTLCSGLLLLLAACGDNRVEFVSDPAGAEVRLIDGRRCVTPCAFEINDRDSQSAIVRGKRETRRLDLGDDNIYDASGSRIFVFFSPEPEAPSRVAPFPNGPTSVTAPADLPD
ncbi:MAG: hypothetical protein AAFR40_10560 [Pseudomonadota bacterium]